MSFVGSLLGVFGFIIGVLIGLFLGFWFLIYSEPADVKVPLTRPLKEFDSNALHDILAELPLWVKSPDYERVDWLNLVIHDMWPYLDKAICGMIRSMAKPIFSEYIGMCQIKSIDFESLTLGTLPPIIQGMKIHELNVKHLIFEPTVRWAGNPNITLVVKVLSLHIKVQLIDLQITATIRITLKPFVPTFPCFSNVVLSLMDKPEIDFGLKINGGDVMAIPGLHHFIQEAIRKQVASLYLWPQTLEIPVLDSSIGATKKPMGILHVKVIRARKLLKKDIIGTSDPYVTLSLSGERIPSKKTSVKMNNLNPNWNEDLKLTVKDPQSQVLELHVYDWEKVGLHDKLGMQVIPLKLLTLHESKEFTLDLLKNLNPDDNHNKKPRGNITVELTLIPFIEENMSFNGPIDLYLRKESIVKTPQSSFLSRSGLLLVTVTGAEDVEGKHHNNPYALVVFKGEQKKTKSLKKTRDPSWNEEFQFMLEEAPIEDKIHIEVISKRRRTFGFGHSREPLGHVDINLIDVVYNSCINEKYHLINSRNGVIHVDIRWNVT